MRQLFDLKKNLEKELQLLQDLHKTEMDTIKVKRSFTLASRSIIRQIRKLNPAPCLFHWLFGLPHPFYFSQGVLILSSDLLSNDNLPAGTATAANKGKLLKHLNRSLNMIREKIAHSDLASRITVPISAYLEYYGTSYLALGVGEILPESLVYGSYPRFGKFEAKNAALSTMINTLCNPSVISEFDVAMCIEIRPESFLVYEKGEGNYVLMLTDCTTTQIKPWVWARKELFYVSEGKKIRQCSECNEIISESVAYYQGTGTGNNKNYLCCISCYTDLKASNMLAVAAKALKHRSPNS